MAEGLPTGAMPSERAMEAEQARAQAEEARSAMMLGILSEEARARLARIKLVKPDKARDIENALLQVARRGQLQGPVQEGQVVKMLEDFSKSEEQTKITFKRRTKLGDDEEEDNDDDLL